nr:MAG TPA: hypothetical protein [Caudoviricetes sp.]
MSFLALVAPYNSISKIVFYFCCVVCCSFTFAIRTFVGYIILCNMFNTFKPFHIKLTSVLLD